MSEFHPFEFEGSFFTPNNSEFSFEQIENKLNQNKEFMLKKKYRIESDKHEAFYHRYRYMLALLYLEKYDFSSKNTVLEIGGETIFTEIIKNKLDLNIQNTNFDLRDDFPIPNSQFDNIICMEVVEHLSDPHIQAYFAREKTFKFLCECNRIMKNNGIIYASTPNINSAASIYRISRRIPPYMDGCHIHEYSVEEISLLFELAGFSIKSATANTVWDYEKTQHDLVQKLQSAELYLSYSGDDISIVAEKNNLPFYASRDVLIGIFQNHEYLKYSLAEIQEKYSLRRMKKI